MCGILAILNEAGVDPSIRSTAYEQSRLQRHRGPDGSGIVILPKCVMAHERLSLIGIDTGDQPLISDNGDLFLISNSEIYNYKSFIPEIEAKRGKKYFPRSDADVIIDLYQIHKEDMLRMLGGMFAFVLYDKKTSTLLVARDPIGILPLYTGRDDNGGLWIASEMKTLIGKCHQIETFEAGCYLYGGLSTLQKKRYFEPTWIHEIPSRRADLDELRSRLIEEVELHMEADTHIGALLSGGLDSSLVAGIASKIMKNPDSEHYGQKLYTFSVGISGSPDLKYARQVADYIGSLHHEITFTVEEGLDCIREMIWFLETYDITTVRASIPMFILARKVKKYGIKIVLSGEGADEIFGGYLYFHSAPDAKEFHKETVRRTTDLSYFDCLRANKSTMAWGVEARVPFLGKTFMDYCMGTDPKDRLAPSALDHEGTGMEKYILRKAFTELGYIPESVIWRQKEQFSDGVGYSWIETLRSHCESQVTDAEFSDRFEQFKYNTPDTKEGYYYRSIFDEIFGKVGERTVKCWVPRTDWGCSSDPSGRKQKAHISHRA